MEQQEVRRSNRILIDAIRKQDYEAVKNLLEKGSNVNEVCYQGNSPLHHAVDLCNFKIIELLLQHNAQVDIENDSETRPIHLALLSYDFNIVNILIQYKAEVRIDDIWFIDFLDYSEEYPENIKKYPEHIKKLLYENVNVEHVDILGRTALHNAVTSNDLNVIRTLISRGADVNKATELEKFTPLHVATSTECIKILLRAGAEPNAQDSFSYSPLCALVMNSKMGLIYSSLIERKEQRRMIEELIRNGANCIEVIDHIQKELDSEASLELRYCLEDVLRFMALKENECQYVNIDDSKS